jgi:hypothetical protein
VDIDAVQQGSADLAEILLNLSRRAAAFPGRIAEEAAFAPVQITTVPEYERGVVAFGPPRRFILPGAGFRF